MPSRGVSDLLPSGPCRWDGAIMANVQTVSVRPVCCVYISIWQSSALWTFVKRLTIRLAYSSIGEDLVHTLLHFAGDRRCAYSR